MNIDRLMLVLPEKWGSPCEDDLVHGVNETTAIVNSRFQRHQIYRFRHEIYGKYVGKYLCSADDSRGLLVDPIDDQSILICSVDEDGKITGTISLRFGPFPAYLEERIQQSSIAGAIALVPPEFRAYVSRLVVDRSRAQHRVTATRLITEAFWVCVAVGIEIGFAHGVKSTVRYFSKWGFLPYGRAFKHEFPRYQQPLINAPGNTELLKQVGSPLLDDLRERPTSERALSCFTQITEWNSVAQLRSGIQ